jgi:hypothetical protein
MRLTLIPLRLVLLTLVEVVEDTRQVQIYLEQLGVVLVDQV